MKFTVLYGAAKKYVFLIFFIFSYINSISFIQHIHPSPFAEIFCYIVHNRQQAQWENPPWGADPRIELGPAFQQANALPTEQRHIR
jgi:hypothetical protein